jgi:aldose 1-epimerase
VTPALVHLRAGPTDGPAIIGADFVPARAMMVLQVRAQVEPQREIDLLVSPAAQIALQQLTADDAFGNAAFAFGGAFLAPFANRITGQVDGSTVHADIDGGRYALAANWGGKAPGARRYAMHGLMLNHPADTVEQPDDARLKARLELGDFRGRWPSRTRLEVNAAIEDGRLVLKLVATNVGDEMLPLGIGWHPYFRLPSGERAQARLHLPARQRLEVNNYDEVLPTGGIVDVRGTPWDFQSSGGAPLGQHYFDDCFVGLRPDPNGEVVCEIIDPAAGYGLRLTSAAPPIQAFQLYAPPDQAFIALEPQFNWPNPFGAEWPPGTDTGMVRLRPGEHISWRVTLELFSP